MDLQTAIVAGVVLFGLAPLLALLKETPSKAARALGVLIWLAASGVVALGADRYREPRAREAATPITGRPIAVDSDGYVSSNECRRCHEDEYSSWHDSFHRRMTQVVTPETVQSRIDGKPLTFKGQTWRLFRDGDRYFAEMDEPAWDAARNAARDAARDARPGAKPPPPATPKRVTRPIVMSTGSHHYEALWVSDEATRKVSLLPFCWRIDQQRWMPVDAAFLVPPDEEQGSEGRWNLTCNKCHATHPRPKVSGRFEMATDVAEFGIACEACHGPGEQHVAKFESPLARYERHLDAKDGARDGEAGPAGARATPAADDLAITNPTKLDPVRASMVCGQCHAAVEFKDPRTQAAWNDHGPTYRPGDDLNDERRFREAGAEKFWPDGMIRTSGREYNGLIHSPCYTHGDRARGVMTCFSCHQLHEKSDDPRARAEWADDQLKPGMRGDLACTQCHKDFARSDAIAKHTHHAAGSIGSSCMDCHMPYQSYGLLKTIRSHTVASPSLAESLDVGRPNACNLCHLDRTLAWAGDKLAEWYGQPAVASARGGKGLTADEQQIASGVLWITRGDAGQRALVACAMERKEVRETAGSGWFAPFLAPLLQDPYPAVRILGERSLKSLPGFGALAYDYLGSAAQRSAASDAARAIWEKASPPSARKKSAALLMDGEGKLDDATLARLRAQRDDRRVVLSE